MASASAAASTEVYPIGINLGPKHITVAQALGEDHAQPVVQISGSKAYQAYYQDTLSRSGKQILKYGQWHVEGQDGKLRPAVEEVHDHPEARGIYYEALNSALAEASLKLGQAAKLGTVSKPKHLNRTSEEALLEASVEIDPSFSTWQIMDHLNMARLAYHLDTCEGLGQDSSSCEIGDTDHVAIFVELHDDRLTLYCTELTQHSVGIVGQISRPELGAHVFSASASSHTSNWSDELFNSTFQELIESHLYTSHPEDDWSFVRGVILLSDTASTAAIGRVRAALRTVVPRSYHDQIRDGVDPNYVVAVGAAHRARAQVKDPKRLDPSRVQHLHDHDEL